MTPSLGVKSIIIGFDSLEILETLSDPDGLILKSHAGALNYELD